VNYVSAAAPSAITTPPPTAQSPAATITATVTHTLNSPTPIVSVTAQPVSAQPWDTANLVQGGLGAVLGAVVSIAVAVVVLRKTLNADSKKAAEARAEEQQRREAERVTADEQRKSQFEILQRQIEANIRLARDEREQARTAREYRDRQIANAKLAMTLTALRHHLSRPGLQHQIPNDLINCLIDAEQAALLQLSYADDEDNCVFTLRRILSVLPGWFLGDGPHHPSYKSATLDIANYADRMVEHLTSRSPDDWRRAVPLPTTGTLEAIGLFGETPESLIVHGQEIRLPTPRADEVPEALPDSTPILQAPAHPKESSHLRDELGR
jgi:hypothetical protein